MNLLGDEDLLRYQRQVAIPTIGEEGQSQLMSSKNSSCSSLGILGPVVGLIGSLQALEVIKELIPAISESDKRHRQFLVFDGKTLSLKKYAIQKDPDCPVCGKEGNQCES